MGRICNTSGEKRNAYRLFIGGKIRRKETIANTKI
jgi:hypothetical protein